MSDHAKFSPSGAHRWLRCPGSLNAESGLPNEDSEYSAEGTAAHMLATRALMYKKPTIFFHDEQLQVGERVFVVDEEMELNVQVHVDEVLARAVGAELFVESRLNLSEVLDEPEQFGTGDAVIVDVPKRHLTIVDLKYGMGVKVYAENNEQMMLYALAALYEYMPAGDFDFITMVIVQPRLDHIDEWTIDVASLLDFMGKARAGVVAAKEPDAPRLPGEKQCRFCKFKAMCPELASMVSKEVFDDFDAVDSPTLQAERRPMVPDTNDQLGIRLGNLNIVEDWCRAIRGECERRVLDGQKILGTDGLAYKIVEGKSPGRKWKPDKLKDAEALLVGQIGTRAYEPQEIISASKAAKIFDKKKTAATWALFGDFYAKARGQPSIARGSDPRPPYEASAGADEFDAVTARDELEE